MKTALQLPPADYKRLTDEELVHRYAHRHEDIALNYLFDRYAHLVLGICMKHFGNAELAKNTTDDLFIKLADDLKRYSIDDFKPWLFQYVKNYSILQANATIPVANNATVIDTDMAFEDGIMVMNAEKMATILEDGIRGLDKDERTCIELFYLKSMNYTQIADKMGYQPTQVKHFLQKGKYHLKEKLEMCSI